jgi:hypothetical protein
MASSLGDESSGGTIKVDILLNRKGHGQVGMKFNQFQGRRSCYYGRPVVHLYCADYGLSYEFIYLFF